MGGRFLLQAFVARVFMTLMPLVRPDLWLRMRRREVAAIRADIVKNEPGYRRTIMGPGVVRIHETTSAFDFFGACGMPVQHVGGGEITEITCRKCKRLRRRAARGVQEAIGGFDRKEYQR